MFFLSFLKDIGNYELRKIGRDTSDSGIEVSTAYTSDEGYETALLDKNGVHPVERYDNRKTAEQGHKKWLEFANTANGKTVKKLCWTGMEEMDKEIVLSA